MSIFLDRQKVRRRRALAKRIKTVERILFSLAVIFGGLAALYGLYLLVFLGPIFPVKEVIIEGNFQQVSKKEVLEIVGIGTGQTLFGVDTTGGHKRLLMHPWIKQAAVRRRLPHTIWIYVAEQVPAAVVINEGKAFFVNRQGLVFKPVESGDPKDYPVISGVAGVDSKEEPPPRLKEALSLLMRYQKSSFGQMWGAGELHLDGRRGYSLTTEKGPVEILLGNDAFDRRLELLGLCQGVISRRGGRITYIIANDNKRITVGYQTTEDNQQPKI